MGNLIKQINEKLDKIFSPNGKKLFFVILAIIILGIICLVLSFNKSSKTSQKNPDIDIEITENEYPSEEDINNDIDIEIDETQSRLVSVDFENIGRADPFLPSSEVSIATRNTNYRGFSLMAPPETLYEESDASKVMTTKVSGILYDSSNPSAILNIEGTDYLVKSGDRINNYKILTISKDLVTVQLGPNVYVAGVGQILNNESPLNYNTVYNLSNRFGGAKK